MQKKLSIFHISLVFEMIYARRELSSHNFGKKSLNCSELGMGKQASATNKKGKHQVVENQQGLFSIFVLFYKNFK